MGVLSECGRRFESIEDITLHHIIELTIYNYIDSNIAYNPDNLKVVCKDCHNKIHKRFGHNNKEVYIIYGAPFAGKEEYVKANIMRGDLVCNIDRIYECLSFQSRYDKPNNLLMNALYIQTTLIDNIKTRYGKWNNAYIIGGYQDKYKREQIQRDTGGELIYIERTKEECISNLYERIDNETIRKEYINYIDKWFEGYTE